MTIERRRILKIAEELVGSPSVKYLHGHPELGKLPARGFDCSGFVHYVLEQAGLEIPDYIRADGKRRPIRHANEFWENYGVPTSLPEPGDLVFFSRNGDFISHIGIYVGKGRIIHSPGKDNRLVEKVKISKAYPKPKLKEAKFRIMHKKRPAGFKSPEKAALRPNYRYGERLV